MAIVYIEGPYDRQLIRRALSAMSELALDEITDAEIDEMFRDSVDFILAALRGLTNEHHRGLPIVTENFGENEILRLDRLLVGITAAATTRIELSGKVKLTEAEVETINVERDRLRKQRDEADERIKELDAAIIRSGEAKLRDLRHIRTWFYTNQRTHGVKGRVTVSLSPGPEDAYVGTAEELILWLHASGYTDLETDIEGLQLLWQAKFGS